MEKLEETQPSDPVSDMMMMMVDANHENEKINDNFQSVPSRISSSEYSSLSHQDGLLVSIFEYLDLATIGLNISLICKHWNSVVKNTQMLWRSICVNELGWPLHVSTDELLFQAQIQEKIDRGEMDALSSPLPSSTKEKAAKSNGKRAISICGKSFAWKDFCYLLKLPATLYFFANSNTSKKELNEYYEEITNIDASDRPVDTEHPDMKYIVYRDVPLIDCIHTELTVLQKQKVLTQISCDKLYDLFIPILEKLKPEPLLPYANNYAPRFRELVLGKNKFSFLFTKSNFEDMSTQVREHANTHKYSLFGIYLLNDDHHDMGVVTTQLRLAFKNNIDFEYSDSLMLKAHLNDECLLFETPNLDLCMETIKTLTAVDLHIILAFSEFDALQTIRRRFAVNSETLEFYHEFMPEKMTLNFEKALKKSTGEKEEKFVVALYRSHVSPQSLIVSLRSVFPQFSEMDCIGIYFTLNTYGMCYVASGTFEQCKTVAERLNNLFLNVMVKTEQEAMEESELADEDERAHENGDHDAQFEDNDQLQDVDDEVF
ncbi:hypothetical protein C9374_005604 [Naegleria lovaniensis]|uniref:F-box domain-containing protein n=1 Tax=Naegleria lovaniensis TaxID=51637 RepID=A0AA88GQ97_NAELO|nr:uncharacterized protein C9374_005604 [Naegleria lovaniensis]KAG2382402.1 hypothetical protein C9374_005604 [Naegleria lovaniensis]